MASKKKWDREALLKRLMRIAEEAKQATWISKTTKEGETVREYDARCASIELKAVEYAVKLAGLDSEEKSEEILVTMNDEMKDLAQ